MNSGVLTDDDCEFMRRRPFKCHARAVRRSQEGFMRSTTICIAILIALAGPASAQTASTTCTRAPHQSARTQTPQLRAARRAERQACAADFAAYCSNVPRGCGAPMKCLKAHSTQLSPACVNAWQNLRAVRTGHG